ncbi:hypothetical protein ARALYDRAFT_916265 [Arabidopsis lyrata subsp. lyrata]|uniref:Uncharacterized protein n=1 Tax=Arabidopsis lyrata subsp. lyrata TaxID=81972 RepID=D7MJD1_ARALL|nr:hypothetical protein ARALYDRAFT_916265 [Arabidopsis lyrata subsp. lyrata]
MVTFVGFLSFIVFFFVICNQNLETACVDEEDTELPATSSSIAEPTQRSDETPNQTQPSSATSRPLPPMQTHPSSSTSRPRTQPSLFASRLRPPMQTQPPSFSSRPHPPMQTQPSSSFSRPRAPMQTQPSLFASRLRPPMQTQPPSFSSRPHPPMQTQPSSPFSRSRPPMQLSSSSSRPHTPMQTQPPSFSSRPHHPMQTQPSSSSSRPRPPIETQPSSSSSRPHTPIMRQPSSSSSIPHPPNGTQPSSSSLPPPERQPSSSQHRRHEASSSYCGNDNRFLNIAPRHHHERDHPELVPEPHHMDALSWMALGYCLTAGLEFNSIYAQAHNDPFKLTPRLIYMSVINMSALMNLIGANAILARTMPRIAFMLDRLGSVLVLVNSILAANPALPLPYAVAYVLGLILAYIYCSICP